jgi:hypothetical protein
MVFAIFFRNDVYGNDIRVEAYLPSLKLKDSALESNHNFGSERKDIIFQRMPQSPQNIERK